MVLVIDSRRTGYPNAVHLHTPCEAKEEDVGGKPSPVVPKWFTKKRSRPLSLADDQRRNASQLPHVVRRFMVPTDNERQDRRLFLSHIVSIQMISNDASAEHS